MSKNIFDSKSKYLNGLDGLRALAVISILLYHLDIYWLFPGGFLGVDIFFTISGFLITYLLLNEIKKNNEISFVNFYSRRAKRLFPALLMLLTICLIVGLCIIPQLAKKTLEDTLPAIFYYSNWWQIFSEQSYFELMSNPPLLQHLWSLAIEEQFYIIWPIIFVISYKLWGQKGLAIFASMLAIASTIWMGWLSIKHHYPLENDPSRVYLGTDTHSMGLLIGASFAALKEQFDRSYLKNNFYANSLSPLALLLLILFLIAMQYRLEIAPELYRGGFLLISVMVGFLILIVSAGESSLGRCLSVRPLVFIGKRAYGLYLWHWPIYIILGITLNNKFQDVYKLLLTFIAAEISYQIVENPFRFNSYKKWTFLKRFLWLILLSIPILFLAVNLTQNYLLDSVLVKSEKIDLNATSPIPRLNESKKEYIEAWRQKKCLRELQKVKPISQDVQITIFGDSVMLGAKNEFAKNIVGTEVEAAVGRQGYEGLSIVRDYKSKGKLGKKVLLHYGTNGFLNEKQMRDILSELSDRELVIIMNVYAQRKWQDENNIMLRKLANEYDNTKLFDWHDIVLSNSSLLSGDQVHPNQKGMELIAKEVKQLSSLPGYQEIDQLRRPIPKSCK